MSQPCFSGCQHNSLFAPKGSSLLSWECLVSCRVRCLPGFLRAHGPFETRPRKIVLKESLFSCPVIKSFSRAIPLPSDWLGASGQ